MDEIYERLHDDPAIENEIVESSEIQQFFSAQTVFVTGCTGFVGKIFVEKLLRSCFDIKRLYVLVRSKKQSSAERMKRYFDDVIFDRLKEENPNFLSKVSTVEGDLTKDNLALSENDRLTLIKETTLMYHNASNVKFDERINVAIRDNVFGTRNMLDLAKQCEQLVAFVYVSTAYSHCYKKHIEEKFYTPPADMKMLSDLMNVDIASPRGMDEKTLKSVRGQWPNNYVFTKSTAESLVEECAKNAPFSCTVFRPSMIMSTYQEPIRAWCGNINGPVGIIVGAGIGFIHAIHTDFHPQDYVPVDMCANALIASTWDAVINQKVKKEGLVYNYGSSTVNRVSGKEFQEKCFNRGQNLPSIHMMGNHYVTYTKCLWHFWLIHLTVHLLTALFADFVLLCRGEKAQAFMFWSLMTKNMKSLIYFSSGKWRIHVDRMQTVWDRMNRRDSELFFCDLRKFSWDDYCYAYWAGLRVYILKDPMKTLKAGHRVYKRFRWIHNCLYCIVRITILYYVGRWLLSILPSVF